LAHVLVIGAGVSGCTTALTLANRGIFVALVEKTGNIGGRVRSYGCKAVKTCQNCGVCLTNGLWEKVSSHKHIDVLINTTVKDIKGFKGNFTVVVEVNSAGDEIKEAQSAFLNHDMQSHPDESELLATRQFEGLDAIAICTGFQSLPGGLSSHLHIANLTGLITGTQLEELMLLRTRDILFEKTPDSIAFIQCSGSRDINEGGLYCSRVCCSYSTRAAKVIRYYYPDCEIVFFYMEMQSVESGDFFKGLTELGIEFVKCRPLKISESGSADAKSSVLTGSRDSLESCWSTGSRGSPESCGSPGSCDSPESCGSPGSCEPDIGGFDNNAKDIGSSALTVEYEDSFEGIKMRSFDLVVLSDGIHAGKDNTRLADVCRLGQDKDGFLRAIGADSGFYVTGCARAPMKIDEAYADSVAVAGEIVCHVLPTAR